MRDTIQIPKNLFEEILDTGRRFNKIEGELEDFLLVTNPAFIKKMRGLRNEHKEGKAGDWQKLKTRYGL